MGKDKMVGGLKKTVGKFKGKKKKGSFDPGGARGG